MIKINVAEIKKRLVGKKDFSYELKPAELNITEADLPLTGTVTVKGTISNVGDVLLLEAMVEAMVNRTCGRCLKAFTGKSTAEVLEKFYPASAENIENDAFIYESDIVKVSCWQSPFKLCAGSIVRACVRSAAPIEIKATAAVILPQSIPGWRH